MAYKTRLNNMQTVSKSDAQQLVIELDLLRAELNDVRTKYAALLAKLDLDAGVTDVNYASLCGLASAQFAST